VLVPADLFTTPEATPLYICAFAMEGTGVEGLVSMVIINIPGCYLRPDLVSLHHHRSSHNIRLCFATLIKTKYFIWILRFLFTCTHHFTVQISLMLVRVLEHLFALELYNTHSYGDVIVLPWCLPICTVMHTFAFLLPPPLLPFLFSLFSPSFRLAHAFSFTRCYVEKSVHARGGVEGKQIEQEEISALYLGGNSSLEKRLRFA